MRFLKLLKFEYPNAVLFIDLILLFKPSINPFVMFDLNIFSIIILWTEEIERLYFLAIKVREIFSWSSCAIVYLRLLEILELSLAILVEGEKVFLQSLQICLCTLRLSSIL